MEAWRWFLIPLLVVDVLALGVAGYYAWRQRKTARFQLVPTEEK